MLGFLKEPPPFFGAVVLPRSAIIGRPRRSSGCREADSAAFGADVRMPPGRLCAMSGHQLDTRNRTFSFAPTPALKPHPHMPESRHASLLSIVQQ